MDLRLIPITDFIIFHDFFISDLFISNCLPKWSRSAFLLIEFNLLLYDL